MKPILFPSTATEFTTQGLGALSDAISCIVTEERNGLYELEMQYPQSGIHFSEIQNRCIVYAIPSPYREAQPFRVYRITRPINGIATIYAQHISYDLAGIPVNPFTAGSAAEALSGMASHTAVESPFSFWTDKSTTANFSVLVPSASRSVLGGVEGSILDVYGGEYLFDKFFVRLYNQRGNDNGVVIRYGKNLTDVEQDANISSVATGVLPYWVGSEGELVQGNIVNVDGTFDFVRIMTIDFSSDFENQPTASELETRAMQYIKSNKIGVPSVSISVSFVQLEQTEEYKDLALLEKCDLCDTVTVQFEALGINAKAEIVRIITDVLLERYESVEVGDIRANIAYTIADQQQKIEKAPTTSAMQQAINNATNQITGNKGGYVILHSSTGSKEPDEILIMDTPNISTATKVWRWNKSGLGYSSSGYNGPYGLAMTQDGAIVADFITTGVLTANLIKAGILQSLNGASSINMETGEAKLLGSLETKSGDEGRVTHVDKGGVWIENASGLRRGMYTNVENDVIVNTDVVMLTDKGTLNAPWGGESRVVLQIKPSGNGDAAVYNAARDRSVALGFSDEYPCLFLNGGVVLWREAGGSFAAWLNIINGKNVSWTYSNELGKYVLTGA